DSELRDELWFIEFGRGAALPLTPEEAPADGEPIVPCAQGRIVVETARPISPHFATCSSYRRRPVLLGANSVASFGYPDVSKGARPRGTTLPQSPAARPEDLRVTPWYADEIPALSTPPVTAGHDHSSYPLPYNYGERELFGHPDLSSTQNSSVEGEAPRPPNLGTQRKAYMDLRDAIALLDETCPNPDAAEPSPRTPRTPLTPHPKSKRARSKSSDNSSNYSNERLSDKSTEQPTAREKEREKKRPFLRKIGISKTEDRPFLAKFTPRIIGKPYLEKIGPSKAVEKPFLDKIGTSKTVDKFTFNIPTLRAHTSPKNTPEVEPREPTPSPSPIPKLVPREARSSFRKRSGKGQLQKMYSFETEDLNSFKGSMSPVKSPRDPLRGASLDDVIETSGPSSLPPLDVTKPEEFPEPEPKSHSVAELVKCRIMSSEEIISSNSCLSSPQEAVSWGNSPKRKNETNLKGPKEHRGRVSPHQLVDGNNLKAPNSPMKRQISADSPEPKSKELAVLRPGEKSPTKSRHLVVQSGSSTLPKQKALFLYKTQPRQTSDDGKSEVSPTQTRRQKSEDILDRMEERDNDNIMRDKSHANLERRGISSDNLKLSREIFITTTFDIASRYQSQELCDQRRELATISRSHETAPKKMEVPSVSQEFSREAFKQLHSKFEVRGQRDLEDTNRQRPAGDSFSSLNSVRSRLQLYHSDKKEQSTSLASSSNERSVEGEDGIDETQSFCNQEIEYLSGDGKGEEESDTENNTAAKTPRSGMTVRSVLRKQKSVDHHSDQELDAKSLRKPKRRIFHEPSQETMDLLTELRKVKSLLKTPSIEKLDKAEEMLPIRFPKKIQLTDREFCLSIERENSTRRAQGIMNFSQDIERFQNPETKEPEKPEIELTLPGPALFEKRCLSLDYADDEKPAKPETRAISLASARSPPSETETTTNSLEFGMICDSKSYCSDVFNTPSDEVEVLKEKTLESLKELDDLSRDEAKVPERNNHCAEVDIAIPIDQKTSPRRRVQIQARTSDLYEIISPRSTPFRVKKRLSKISVEETLKQESFTLGKVDCRSVAVQKRNRCFPL
ncbi:uncharacterized protein LOC105684380, partial [Athalia rosae]|uniref:uncharacterized protein LOC105684380 n=1 Tax=Athalia rosae TaxID=37344 RepID=UPI0020333002